MENPQLNAAKSFELVQDGIRLVEARMYAQADQHHPDLKTALYYLLKAGGKRIRPTLTLLTGDMLHGDRQQLVVLAAAIELLHTATLVHDDLIDGALLRRGNPTLNARWSPAATVLTGDFLFAQAAKLAAEAGSQEAMLLFSETLNTIVNGEITQLFSSHGLTNREDYYRRIKAKTASLFRASMAVAALVCPVGEEIIEAVSQYGHEVGMAFQIVDDVLDFTGNQETVGKPVASDLRQGLITLPSLYYLETNPEDKDLAKLMSGLSSDERVEKLVGSICQSGAIHKALDEASGFAERAIDALSILPENPEHRALEELAYYIVKRPL